MKTFILLILIICLFNINNGQILPNDWIDRIEKGLLIASLSEPEQGLMPSIGNGYVSYVINSSDIYIGGIYNGPAISTDAPSHKGAIPNFQNISMIGSILEYVGLDMDNGTYTRVYSFGTSSPNVIATQVYYAHQSIRNILVQEITIDNSMGDEDFNIQFSGISFNDLSSPDFTIDTYSVSSQVAQFNLTIITPELGNDFVSVGVTTTVIPADQVTIKSGESKKFYFLTSFVTTLEETQNYIEYSGHVYKASYSLQDSLLKSHKLAWKKLWDSKIEVGGNLPLQQVITTAYYYILSSIRSDWAWSLSPGGLSTNGYNSHVFWDSETWMYPSVLALHSKLARDAILQYRLNHLKGASEKAASYEEGYQGYMFPWESAFTGTEVCPTFAPTGLLEQHITGDISFAMRQYYYLTGDLKWLDEKAYTAIKGMAEFWASRVSNETFSNGAIQYHINIVIPPDEYAIGVNNSVYTNVIAKYALEWGIEAAYLTNDSTIPLQQWQLIADNLKIPFNETTQTHPEYDGYSGETVKQADVILLGYPLMYNMSTQVRSNDLTYYQSVTDSNGPCMTYAMFVCGWLELGNLTMASELWPNSYSNAHEPFWVWTETPQGGTVNFITGAGGFLQGVMFGYGGMRIHSNYLEFNPQLPPDTNSLKLKGVNYLEAKLDISWNSYDITVELRSNKNNVQLTLTMNSNGTTVHLKDNSPLSLPITSFTIQQQQEMFTSHKIIIN